jgi:hypothetical protein
MPRLGHQKAIPASSSPRSRWATKTEQSGLSGLTAIALSLPKKSTLARLAGFLDESNI